MRERGLVGPSDAGRAIGISQSLVSSYLNGHTAPQRRTVKKLAAWSGESEVSIWELIPEDPRLGPGSPVSPAPDDLARRIAALEAEAQEARRRAGPQPAPPPHPVTTRPGDPTAYLAPRDDRGLGGESLHLLRTDDLDTPLAVVPIANGALLWLDPHRVPVPRNARGLPDAVVVERDGTVYARLVGPDGVALVSGVAGAVPLRLDDPGVVLIGTVYHTQMAR